MNSSAQVGWPIEHCIVEKGMVTFLPAPELVWSIQCVVLDSLGGKIRHAGVRGDVVSVCFVHEELIVTLFFVRDEIFKTVMDETDRLQI